ncbi:MAG: PIN domain-containing protein [Saprospiraceae bacterium]
MYRRNKVFIDTSILIYMQSGMSPAKMKISRELFEKSSLDNLIVLSTQVLQEFFVTMTLKLNHDPITIKNLLGLFDDFEIITVNASLIFDAIDTSVVHQLSFWDSLIICSASSSHCKVIYTEDMNHGQVIRGVEIVNPFK